MGANEEFEKWWKEHPAFKDASEEDKCIAHEAYSEGRDSVEYTVHQKWDMDKSRENFINLYAEMVNGERDNNIRKIVLEVLKEEGLK